MIIRRQRLTLLLLLPFGLLVVPFLIAPAVFGLFASFTNFAPFENALQFVGFKNYLNLLRDDVFRASVRNTLLLVVCTVTLEMLIGFGIAWSLRKPFRGRALTRFVLLIPWLISPIASGLMWHYLFSDLNGILNFWFATIGRQSLIYPLNPGLALLTVILTDVWRKAPFVSFLVLPGLLSILPDQWDQARLDGLRSPGQIRHVALPHLRLLLLTIMLLLIGESLGSFENTLMLTGGGPGIETQTVGLYSFENAFKGFNWTGGTTSVWFIVVTVLVVGGVYLLISRQSVGKQ